MEKRADRLGYSLGKGRTRKVNYFLFFARNLSKQAHIAEHPKQQPHPIQTSAAMAFNFWHQFFRLTTATLLLILAACGGPSREIIGKWRMSGDPNSVVWEFAATGRVTIGTIRGRYTFGDNRLIKIETPFAKSVYQIEILRDHMTFRESTGSRLQFDRVR
jgi:hypothetical protein